jgi:hypothetical protein
MSKHLILLNRCTLTQANQHFEYLIRCNELHACIYQITELQQKLSDLSKALIIDATNDYNELSKPKLP